jgi:hypothetical protein
MSLSNVFKTSTSVNAVTDGSEGNTSKPAVSDFLTVQSFTNFAAMSGAITAAWHASASVFPPAASPLFPYICSLIWAVISYQTSKDGLTPTAGANGSTVPWGTALQASFIAFVNSLVLAGSVVGTSTALKVATH